MQEPLLVSKVKATQDSREAQNAPHEVNLLLYNVHAVTEGTDAQATVSVRIEEKGKTTVGQAADTDTLVASANAYLNALNKLIIKRTKTAPDQSISAQQ